MKKASKTLKHLKQGTLLKAIAGKLGKGTGERARWYGARSEEEAARYLVDQAIKISASCSKRGVLCIGGATPFQQAVVRLLAAAGLEPAIKGLSEALAIDQAAASGLCCILDTELQAFSATRTVEPVMSHPVLSALPFESVSGLERERKVFRDLDEYASDWFLSPVLLNEPNPYAIYEESLKFFEQKCGLRDYLDLYQALQSIEQRGVQGSVSEFGSYRGHSGWLIARSLQSLGANRQIRLFDTFDRFPSEAGVDHFWSGSHQVNFESVKAKFDALGNVSLVKGDFTQTLKQNPVGPAALIYVDCDSYRAIEFLCDELYEQQLVQGGMMIFEDYGHPALLGCRAAVHRYFDGRKDCLRFYSQFSGLYFVTKL